MQEIWKSNHYYEVAKRASQTAVHPAIAQVTQIAKACKTILEVGCGDGTKLHQIAPADAAATGIDLSAKGIEIAQKQYPEHIFLVANAEKLPLKTSSFDLVYSAFTLEHTVRPEQVINEMIRVAKRGAYVVLVAPNYGAPFRKSPCFRGSRISKIFRSLIHDVIGSTKQISSLNWQQVEPLVTEDYQIDFDTTVEPYLYSLVKFMHGKPGHILKSSSCWEIDEEHETMVNKMFRYLANKHITPFVYWGPHLYLLWQKD